MKQMDEEKTPKNEIIYKSNDAALLAEQVNKLKNLFYACEFGFAVLLFSLSTFFNNLPP